MDGKCGEGGGWLDPEMTGRGDLVLGVEVQGKSGLDSREPPLAPCGGGPDKKRAEPRAHETRRKVLE